MAMKDHFFVCECFSDEHTLRFTLDDDEDYPDLFLSVFLSDAPRVIDLPHFLPTNIARFLDFIFVRPLTRIVIAVKYIFGFKSKYGHWGNYSMKVEDVDRLIEILNKFKEAKQNI